MIVAFPDTFLGLQSADCQQAREPFPGPGVEFGWELAKYYRKTSSGEERLVTQVEVVEQRFRAVVLPHHDQQASDDRNQIMGGPSLLTCFC